MKSNSMQKGTVESNISFMIYDFWEQIFNTDLSIHTLLTKLCRLLQAKKISIEYLDKATTPPNDLIEEVNMYPAENTDIVTKDSKYIEFRESLLEKQLTLKVFEIDTDAKQYSEKHFAATCRLLLVRLIQDQEQHHLHDGGAGEGFTQPFLRNVTRKHVHDVRNHLGIIKGYTTTLLRQDVDWPRETKTGFLKTINSESDQISDLVTNYYTLWTITNHQFVVKKQLTKVNEMAAHLIRHNQSKHQQLQIHSNFPEESKLFCLDPALIELLLQNFIDILAKDDENLAIWIKITGEEPGLYFFIGSIPPSLENFDENDLVPGAIETFSTDHLPDPFFGIISDEILIQHNGTIKFEQNAEGKSRFTLFLPNGNIDCL